MDLFDVRNDRLFGHSHGHNSEDSKNITLTKVICMIFLGLSSFVSGNIPLILSNLYDKKQYNSENERLQARRRKRKVISVLLSFTGGVLFCVIFFHLLPEVSEVFEELRKEDYKDLPEYMPQALLCAGFIIMYFVEELAHKLMHSGKRSERNISDNQVHPYDPQLSLSYDNYGKNDMVEGEKMSSFINNVISITEEASKNLSFEDRQKIISYISDATNKQQVSASIPYNISTGNPIRYSPESGCHNSDIHELELVATSSDRSAVRSFLLALALSVHALFEGMAIGLEKRSAAVWLMFVGVGSHKILLSVCMGIEMVAGNIRKVVHISYVTMFAVLSPLGMGVGAFLSTEHDALSAIFQGIAAGTLLYVLFFEILKRNGGGSDEHSGVESGFSSFFGIVIGFALMAALLSLADD